MLKRGLESIAATWLAGLLVLLPLALTLAVLAWAFNLVNRHHAAAGLEVTDSHVRRVSLPGIADLVANGAGGQMKGKSHSCGSMASRYPASAHNGKYVA